MVSFACTSPSERMNSATAQQPPTASSAPRVAFFPDTFTEPADGVSHTSRRFEAYARNHGLPLLTICGGPRNERVSAGSVTHVTLRRSRVGFALEPGHDYDLIFMRHYRAAARLLQEFRPDIVQLTGPSDVGVLGELLAHRLHFPLVANFQTNLHQFARMRLSNILPRFTPKALSSRLLPAVEWGSLKLMMEFYKVPRLAFAPNQELIDLLAKTTHKPVLLMPHGVDTADFSPAWRDRAPGSPEARSPQTGPLKIGYVWMLSAEKNLRWLPRLEKWLLDQGLRDFQFVVVGRGVEEPWLRKNLQNAVFTGLLQGEALSRAFANMDIFAFPSETDTFGLVVLEALSSGVPAVVTASGGPKYSVQDGVSGFVAADFNQFAAGVAKLFTQPDLRLSMGQAARRYAESISWDHTFETMYAAYDRLLASQARPVATEMAYGEIKD